MPKLILILGDLAAGKTTLAEKSAKETNTLCLIKDTLKEILSDDIGFSNREENKRLSIASVSVMKYVFSKYNVLQKDLILEANFHKDEIEYFYIEAIKNNYDFICLYLQGNIDELFETFTYRLNFQNRHIAHKTSDIISKEGFSKYLTLSREEIVNSKIPTKTIFKLNVHNKNYDEVFQNALKVIK